MKETEMIPPSPQQIKCYLYVSYRLCFGVLLSQLKLVEAHVALPRTTTKNLNLASEECQNASSSIFWLIKNFLKVAHFWTHMMYDSCHLV